MIRSLESRERTTCPICNAPIMMVCDGLVGAQSTIDGGAIQKVDQDDAKNNIITFKYGKQVYRLSMHPQKNSSNNDQTNIIGWAMNFLWPFAQGDNGNKNSSTAQHRIAEAFGMNFERGIKILHKGKVLYPISSVDQSSTSESSSMKELSNRLLEIGKSDWESSNKKISLVVMGTRSGSEVFGRRDENRSNSGILGTLMHLPFRILQFSITLCFHFFGSIVRPLLPPSQHDHED